MTAKTLHDLGLQPEDMQAACLAASKRTVLPRRIRTGSTDLDKMDEMTQASLDRLYDFQHDDGGWGWWKEDDSDHWMTAYVVWGLSLAREAGVNLKSGVLRHANNYLNLHLVDEKDNYDMQAFMLHALASSKNPKSKITKFQQVAFDNLWNHRDQLNAYTRALLALCAHDYEFGDKAKTLVENLENGVIRDDHPDQSVLMGNNRRQRRLPPSWAQRIGARTVFIGTGRIAAWKQRRLPARAACY